jgi:regulator of replication initiation timing
MVKQSVHELLDAVEGLQNKAAEITLDLSGLRNRIEMVLDEITDLEYEMKEQQEKG